MFQSAVSEPFVRQNWAWGGGAALVFLSGTLVMLPQGSLHTPGSVPPFLAGAALMLAGFYIGLWKPRVPGVIIVAVALAARLLLLWQAPGDDIYRYIWEGKLLLNHVNPYLHAPDATALISLRDKIWESVGHKAFPAIYPPLAEWSFAVLALISPSVFFFKTAFALADLVTGALLWRRYGGSDTLFYLWNPLIVYSFAGGGHYDSFFILALVLGWLAWNAGKPTQALLWLGAAVATKWMALPILGWAVWRLLQKSGPKTAITNGMAGIAPVFVSWAFTGLWTTEWTWHLYPEKFTEYARSAEWIPRIAGWLWEESRYHNSWFLSPVAVAWVIVILKARRFVPATEWSLFLAMIFSPLVHAWYFTWLMPFAVASRNPGSILLSASGFVYFAVYHRTTAEGWVFRSWEVAMLWLPFVLGFIWTYLRRQHDNTTVSVPQNA